MLHGTLLKQTILDGCALFIGRHNTNELYNLFIKSGLSEDMALLKLELIFRICDIGVYVE